MSDGTVMFVVVESACACVLAGYLTVPQGRAALIKMLLEMRRLYVIAPLRLITGRRQPNYRRIRELERELSQQ
jgi:hypothetical protein